MRRRQNSEYQDLVSNKIDRANLNLESMQLNLFKDTNGRKNISTKA